MRIQIIAHNTEKNPAWKYFYLRYLKFKPDVLISVGPIAFVPTLLKKLKLIRNADFITTPCISKMERCEVLGKKAFYIPHGVSADFDEKKPINLEGNIKVLYAGEQSKVKRVDKLIKDVKDINCDLYLLGKINEKFKEIAPENVHFMGIVKHSELPSYLKAADILVLTADDDCTLKMFEYVKAGKTILGIRGRLNYFLTHLENAYLTDDLAKGLKELINNEELRSQLANNVKKIKIYTWEEIAREYIKFLDNIVGNTYD